MAALEFDNNTRLYVASQKVRNIKALPEANLLINHLKGHGVPMALASNSCRSNIEAKNFHHVGWKESFVAIVGGDEVKAREQSPEIFLEAAKSSTWIHPAFSSLKIQWIEGTLPLEPWCIGGPVIKGFRCGSKVLEIPLAVLFSLFRKICKLGSYYSLTELLFGLGCLFKFSLRMENPRKKVLLASNGDEICSNIVHHSAQRACQYVLSLS